MTASPPSTDDILRDSVRDARVVTLDPRFQGLPDTAHGGTVLALFDTLAPESAGRSRVVAGTYRRRVPLGAPLSLAVARDADVTRLRLSDGGTLLVDGAVSDAGSGTRDGVQAGAPSRGEALPLSKTCFACGTENALGLRAELRMDDESVHGVWKPDERFRTADSLLAPVALTTLLDEAAFWLGAAASGESGMTTELRVALHGPVAFGTAIFVGGERAGVRARADDARYWDTSIGAWSGDGTLVASASITFVAVRGAARKLVNGLLAVNSADVLRRVFPAYVQ